MSSGDLVALITRWWEEEADYTAACSAPDPSLCSNHVFEEAVRVDGEIVACTVHGGRLARSLAAFLERAGREEEARVRAAFRERHPIGLAAVHHPEAYLAQFRQEREGTWPNPPGCVDGCDYGITGRHAKRGGRVLCRVEPDLDSVARQAYAAMQQDDEADEELAEEQRRRSP